MENQGYQTLMSYCKFHLLTSDIKETRTNEASSVPLNKPNNALTHTRCVNTCDN